MRATKETLADMGKNVSSGGTERGKRARSSVIYRFSCALEAKFVCWLKEKQHHRKDLSSGVQRTDGGGEPRPIRGTFSYRGVPPNRAAWFLGRKGRPSSDAGGRASNAKPALLRFSSHVFGRGGVGDGRRGRVEAVLAAHAAAVAAEAVHVGEVGVLGADPPRPGVERVLLVDVVVVSFSEDVGKRT